MKLLSIEFAQVVWILDVAMPSGSVYFPDALRKVEERYSFVDAPIAKDILANEGNLAFQHGKFKSNVIKRFSIHNDGVVANSLAGTDVAEEFCEDFIGWSKTEFGLEQREILESYRMFSSQVIVQMDPSFLGGLTLANKLGKILGTYSQSYGLEPSPFVPSGLIVRSERNKFSSAAADFYVERRAEIPMEKNVFFSSAPLKTADHLSLMELIESEGMD